MMREHPNMFVTDKKKMLDEIQSKLEEKIKGRDDFEKGVYFEHFTLDNPAIVYDKKLLSKAKINGDFRMRLPKSLPQNERVTALAHESLAYYMHQKGRFFDIIKNKQTIDALKRNKNEKSLKTIIYNIQENNRKASESSLTISYQKPNWKDIVKTRNTVPEAKTEIKDGRAEILIN